MRGDLVCSGFWIVSHEPEVIWPTGRGVRWEGMLWLIMSTKDEGKGKLWHSALAFATPSFIFLLLHLASKIFYPYMKISVHWDFLHFKDQAEQTCSFWTSHQVFKTFIFPPSLHLSTTPRPRVFPSSCQLIVIKGMTIPVRPWKHLQGLGILLWEWHFHPLGEIGASVEMHSLEAG